MSDQDTTNTVQVTANPATARVDVQDPLPETNWLWRRLFTFIFALISVVLITYALQSLHQMQDADKVYRMGRYMIGVHVLLMTYYMLAPSAEQMVKLIQSARLIREGATISRTAAVETPEGARTEVSTTAGPAATPPTQGGSGRPPERRQDDEEDVAPRSRS